MYIVRPFTVASISRVHKTIEKTIEFTFNSKVENVRSVAESRNKFSEATEETIITVILPAKKLSAERSAYFEGVQYRVRTSKCSYLAILVKKI